MSLITKITSLFSKIESSHQVGVALRQDSLAYCFIPENSATKQQELPLKNNSYQELFISLISGHQLSGQCHLVLSASQYQIVQVDKPSVPDAEVCAALKWQIKDLVTISPDDMVLDYFNGPTLSGGIEKINVVCASMSALKEMIAPLLENDLLLKTITTEEFAFASLLPVQDDACLLVCQQPNEEVVLLIVKQGKLFFHRRLRGFAKISTRSEDELVSMGTIDALSLEIQRSTDYFERQLKQAPIKAIKLIVATPTEKFLVTKLAGNTNIPVSILALPDSFNADRGNAAALGATMLNTAEEIA
jgi:MSHA biogenesis protein MshI